MLIRIVDLETTGFTPPEAAVVEVGWCDLVATGTNLLDEPAGWEIGRPDGVLVNPGRPIPPETSAIHHIIDEDVRDAASWSEAVSLLRQPPSAVPIAVFAAHNAKFERQWLTDDVMGGLPFICTYKAALRLWPDAPVHSNQGLRYWRNPAGIDRLQAMVTHRAGPDAYVTAFLLRELLAEASIEQLVTWSTEPALLAKCHIGSWRGRRWSEIDEVSFLNWILNRDFDEDVMHTARFYRDKLREQARQTVLADDDGDF
ncbi:exonuclease domain-containing protein [Salinarimonas soli]|uniref:3'-5' exonuclease n=1 Tax=Salinarimonas soli TaxID=1638099 RepID=A0A5B2VGT3_9HYPH|nr:exonuclease domain-containing protein [Salinarimonas soli]KAA2237720.1 3'-5' exonuclease [Salinarimonas soli]